MKIAVNAAVTGQRGCAGSLGSAAVACDSHCSVSGEEGECGKGLLKCEEIVNERRDWKVKPL